MTLGMKGKWAIRVGLIDMIKSHLPLVSLIIILGSVPITYAMFLTPVEIIDSTGDGAGNLLDGPNRVATDSSGNVFVTGLSSNNVFKITPGGTITEIIDSTGDGAGNTLSRPFGVATDSSGNVFVTGLSSRNAFKITPGGTITEIIDTTGDGAGKTLSDALGIATDSSGNVFVTGALPDNAFKITPGGTITEIIDAAGDGGGNQLLIPAGVATDSSGNVFVTGGVSDNAFKITPGGTITEIINATGDGGGNVLDGPFDVATDSSGNVFVAGFDSDNAFKITPGGTITEIIDSTGDGAGNTLSGPFGIATDSSGNVFVAGRNSDNAFKLELEPSSIQVDIDIRPGIDPNILKVEEGSIRVAILGSATFDVSDVNVTTLKFGPNEASPDADSNKFQDVNNDGFPDLTSKYLAVETGISLGDTEACLTGNLFNVTPFEGCDSVVIKSKVCSLMDKFIKDIESIIIKGEISQDDGQLLITAFEELEDILGCP